MTKNQISRVCVYPKIRTGGPASFQAKLFAGLAARGIELCYDLDDLPYDVLLITGGVRNLKKLAAIKARQIPIVQRLDGINWVHKRSRTGLLHHLRSEYANWVISNIRKKYSDFIIYQSEFVRQRWQEIYGPVAAANKVVHNGVDLSEYTPAEAAPSPTEPYRIALVEGGFGGGHEYGLETIVRLLNRIEEQYSIRVEAHIAGQVPEASKAYWKANSTAKLHWAGLLPPDAIPAFNQKAHLFFSAELNAACPNSVIEALACGLPVLAFDTGSLSELVGETAGRIVPFGGNPWKNNQADVSELAVQAYEIIRRQPAFRAAARQRAEAAFNVDKMIDEYVGVFQDLLH